MTANRTPAASRPSAVSLTRAGPAHPQSVKRSLFLERSSRTSSEPGIASALARGLDRPQPTLALPDRDRHGDADHENRRDGRQLRFRNPRPQGATSRHGGDQDSPVHPEA